MSFDDFVQRGLARVKSKLGVAGNRATPSFDDLHAAVGEVLQHVADEVPAAAAPAAPPPVAPARDLASTVWDKIEAEIDSRVAAAIAALPPPAPALPLSTTVDHGAPMDKPNAGLPSGEFGAAPPPLPPVPPLPPAASPPIGA